VKKVLVLGLGNFGLRLVQELSRREGLEIFALDRAEKPRNLAAERTTTFGGNLENPEVLTRILEKIGKPDSAVISLGSSVNATTLTALRLRTEGITRIFIKAEDDNHAAVLAAIDRGVEGEPAFRVTIPEQEAAVQMAGRVASDLVHREVILDDDFELADLVCPNLLAGTSLAELEVRNRYGLTIVSWRPAQGGSELAGPDTVLEEGCRFTVVGSRQDVRRFVQEFTSS